MNATSPRHPHLAWIWPLLAMPVVFVGMILISGSILNAASPPLEWIFVLPFALAFLGPAALLVLSVLRAVRLHRDARARAVDFGRAGDPRIHRPSLADQDAARRGLTREEYGVYKGSVGSAVEPVNSAGGLLVISIILSVMAVAMLALVGVAMAQDAGLLYKSPDASEPDAGTAFLFVLTMIFPIWSWRMYVVERRAQKLRVERGLPKNLR